MATIGNFTADKEGFNGTLQTLTLNVKAKLVPNDKGGERESPGLPRAGGQPRHRCGMEEDQRGRAELPVRDHRRSFVPGAGLRPSDRGRGRHTRPDLVAQQAPGGVTAAAPRQHGGAQCCSRSAASTSAVHVGLLPFALSLWLQKEQGVSAHSTAGLSGYAPCRLRRHGHSASIPHAFAPAALRADACTPEESPAGYPRRAGLGVPGYPEPTAPDRLGKRRCALWRIALPRHGLQLLAHLRQEPLDPPHVIASIGQR